MFSFQLHTNQFMIMPHKQDDFFRAVFFEVAKMLWSLEENCDKIIISLYIEICLYIQNNRLWHSCRNVYFSYGKSPIPFGVNVLLDSQAFI